jgi:esterase/lipase superfamily enzyme
MIILLSNRSVDASKINPFSGEGGCEFFGDELSGNDGQDIRLAEADYEITEQDDDFDEDGDLGFENDEIQYDWSVKPVDAGDEADFLNNLANRVRSGELSDRWIFFVHGNNQTIHKNLEKCRKLQMIHNVNVIAFSWPSWASIFSRAMLNAAGKEILKSGGLSKVNPFFLFGKSAIKSKQAAYAKAVEHAKKSPPALLKALQLVDQHFASPLRDEGLTLNLIVHSLGNRVLQYTSGLAGIPAMFDNAILHQADVDSASHASWVGNLDLSKRLYITHNRRDSVLHISDLFGNNPKRLGHKVKGARATNVTAYIDYSEGRHVGLNHGLFLMEGWQNERLTESFTRILNGEALFADGALMEGFEHPANEAQVVSLRKANPIDEEPSGGGANDPDDPLYGVIDWNNVG